MEKLVYLLNFVSMGVVSAAKLGWSVLFDEGTRQGQWFELYRHHSPPEQIPANRCGEGNIDCQCFVDVALCS